MVPLWVWLSRLTITEEMDKKPCIEYCANQNSKLITVGHLDFASEFEILRKNFMNPKTTLLTRLDKIVETENRTSFRAHVEAAFDWGAKTWYSGSRPISANHWIDNSDELSHASKMPFLDDIGIAVFYQTNKGDTWTVQSCLFIHSSTDLRTQKDLEIELFCKNSSGIFNLGLVEYDSYRTKCLENNGTIAHPTKEIIEWADKNRSRRFWTKIERTGPSEGTILQYFIVYSITYAHFDEW